MPAYPQQFFFLRLALTLCLISHLLWLFGLSVLALSLFESWPWQAQNLAWPFLLAHIFLNLLAFFLLICFFRTNRKEEGYLVLACLTSVFAGGRALAPNPDLFETLVLIFTTAAFLLFYLRGVLKSNDRPRLSSHPRISLGLTVVFLALLSLGQRNAARLDTSYLPLFFGLGSALALGLALWNYVILIIVRNEVKDLGLRAQQGLEVKL